MLRKILSFLIIISILCPDIARAMDEERGSPQKSSRHRPSFSHPQLQKNTTSDIFDDEQTEVYQTSGEESLEDNSSLASQSDESFPPSETPPIAGMVAAAFGFPGSPPSGTELKHWNHYSKSRGERFTIQDLPPLTQSHSLNDSDEEERLLGDSIYLFSDDVSPKTRHFLEYLKDRVIDGKPTLKQALISGFLGSLIGGGMVYAGGMIFWYGVYWGIPCYSYLSFLKDYFGEGVLNNETFTKSALAFGGITLGLDSLVRNYKILAQFSAPSQSFLIERSKAFKAKEIVLKSGLYIAGIAASAIPLSCVVMAALIPANDKKDFIQVFYPAAIPVLFDTTLNYGYFLSERVEHYLNQKFLHEWRSTRLSTPAELKRKDYLTELKNLKWMLYLADEDDIHELYEQFIVNCFQNQQFSQNEGKDLKLQDALRVLAILQGYAKQKDEQDFEKPMTAGWKSSMVTALGWGIPILATAARVLAFYAAVGDAVQSLDGAYERLTPHMVAPESQVEPNDLFKRNLLSQHPDNGACMTDWVTNLFSSNLSPALLLTLKIILGGIIASNMQGALEVKAIKHKVSNLLNIPKVPEEGTSHPILRTGLSFWNYLICGPLHTLPYLWIGLKIINSHLDDSDIFLHILLLVPFLLSDICTNGMLFDESSNDIVSGVDSALSYKYASAGYKRDKLVRMTREIRRLFKELDPEILLEVDERLSDHKPIQENSYDNIHSDDAPL